MSLSDRPEDASRGALFKNGKFLSISARPAEERPANEPRAASQGPIGDETIPF